MTEEKFVYPKCGALILRDDKFCKNCGTQLMEPYESVPQTPPPAEHAPEEFYESSL